MFVGKVDRDNTIHLIKMRMKENFFAKKLGIFLTILFGINLITLFQNFLMYSDNVTSISSNVFSLWGFSIALIVCGIYTVDFKEYYIRHQIYPQNNFSRVTSHEIYCYINFFLVQVYCLLLYLLEIAIVLIIKTFTNNIELAYQFNLQYIFAGFFVTVMYGFLLIALFILYTTLLRKFKIPFAILSFVIAIYLLRSLYLSAVLDFYIKEPSILLFLIKALCTWFIIVAFNHVINKYTKFNEIEKAKLKKNRSTVIVAIVAFIFAIIFITIPFYSYKNRTDYKTIKTNDSTRVEVTDINSDSDNPTQYIVKKVIDVSSIPEGSNLTIQMPKELVNNDNLMDVSIFFGEEFTNPSNNKIIIEYLPASDVINYINLKSFTKPEFNVWLKDKKIYFSENYRKNVKVVILSPYSFMTQFDYFKGKQIFKENIGTMQGGLNGHIAIYQPEGKKLNLNMTSTNDEQ